MPRPVLPVLLGGQTEREGEEKNHCWPLPVYRPAWSRPPVSQDAARDRDAEAVSCPNGLLLFSTPFIGLSLSSRRHVDHLSLGLGPSKTGGQTILSTEPLRFLHPSSAACSPGGTQNTRPTACANKHVHVPRRPLHGLLYESPALGSCLWPGGHLYLKTPEIKDSITLTYPFRPGSSIIASTKPTRVLCLPTIYLHL